MKSVGQCAYICVIVAQRMCGEDLISVHGDKRQIYNSEHVDTKGNGASETVLYHGIAYV